MQASPGKILLLVIALGAYLFAGYLSISTLSPTYDEPFHLTAGYIILEDQDYQYQGLWHPPLAEMTAASALYSISSEKKPSLETSQPRGSQAENYIVSDAFLYENLLDADQMIRAGRILNWLVFLSVLLVSLWATARLLDPQASIWAVLLLLVEPNLLAHGTLITTDFSNAALGLAAFCSLAWYVRKQNSARAALVGLTWAAGWLCKYTAALIFAPLLIWLFLEQKRLRIHVYWKRHLLVASVCFALVFAAVFQLSSPLIFFKGFANTLVSAVHGRENFFMGQHSSAGWWLFFPTALLLKIPLTILAAAMFGYLLAFLHWRKTRDRTIVFLFVVPLFLLLMAAQSRIQGGLRYVLPVVPFLLVMAGYLFARLSESIRGAWLVCILSILTAGASSYRVTPWYLSYYNTLVRSPEQGYQYFTDSNTDWGQALGKLAAYVHGINVSSLYLSYFGTARPEYYGLKYIPIAFSSDIPRSKVPGSDPTKERRILLAVSATNYQHTFGEDKTIWSFLRDRTAIRTFGYSIFLYDLTDDPEALSTLAELLRRDERTEAASSLENYITENFN